MRQSFQALLAMSVVAAPVAAWCEPATDAGAKAVEAAIRAYGPDSWSAPGVVRVRPEGERYSLIFDTAKAISARIAPWTLKDATPVTIGLEKQSDGLWRFNAAGALRLATEQLAGNRTNAVSLTLGGKTLKGVFDPAISLPRSADLGFADAELSLRAAQDSMKIAAKSFSMTSALKDLPESHGDVDADFAMTDVAATTGTFPNPEVKLSAAQVDGTYKLGKLDLAGIAALVRFQQSLPPGKDVTPLAAVDRERLRELFKAHLPLLDAIGGTATASGLSLSQGGKGFTIERLDYHSRWEGIRDRGAFVIGAEISNARVTPGVWPTALDAVLPSAARLNLRLTGFDMAAMWRDAALVRSEQEMLALPRDHTTKLMFPDGKITAELSETTAKSSFYDISLSGRIQLSMDRTSLPVGTLEVRAKDFDKTVRYLQDNGKAVPIFGRAAFIALMAKGLGAVQADGSLLWQMRFDQAGKITVNGQALPM